MIVSLRCIIILWLFFSSAVVKAQTFQQWAQTVNWDGVSHWKRYMIIQPAYMGPNALPVPQLSNGSIDSNTFIASSVALHYSKGDNTQNINLYANYCLVKDRIAFDLSWVPYEHYTMSQAIKEQRHVFSHFFYDRNATGELNLATNIQLLNKWRKYFHSALRLGYRFPTSSGLGTARFSDAPGYYFDLSVGKPTHHSAFMFEAMLGFYSWQLQSDRHQQDDAFLFGLGVEWNKNNWRIQGSIAGYLGYLEDSGDKPIVTRLHIDKKINKWGWVFRFQQGLHDLAYTTAEAGIKYYFKKK